MSIHLQNSLYMILSEVVRAFHISRMCRGDINGSFLLECVLDSYRWGSRHALNSISVIVMLDNAVLMTNFRLIVTLELKLLFAIVMVS